MAAAERPTPSAAARKRYDGAGRSAMSASFFIRAVDAARGDSLSIYSSCGIEDRRSLSFLVCDNAYRLDAKYFHSDMLAERAGDQESRIDGRGWRCTDRRSQAMRCAAAGAGAVDGGDGRHAAAARARLITRSFAPRSRARPRGVVEGAELRDVGAGGERLVARAAE